MPSITGTPTALYKTRKNVNHTHSEKNEHFDMFNTKRRRYLVSATHYQTYFAADQGVISLS
jgi:hypothetical protein